MVVKINVSMPKELLEKLDEAAREANSSRSAFLSQAIKSFLEEKAEERKRQQRIEAVKSIRRLAEEIGPWDGTKEILKWRDSH
jgi:metal-responsive CopG/Arc/MetJ family transcriptional regulator